MNLTANTMLPDVPTAALPKASLDMPVGKGPDIDPILGAAIGKTIEQLDTRFPFYFHDFDSNRAMPIEGLVANLNIFLEPLKLNVIDSDDLTGVYNPLANFLSFIVIGYKNQDALNIKFIPEDVYAASAICISRLIDQFKEENIDEETLDKYYKFVANVARKFRESFEAVKVEA